MLLEMQVAGLTVDPHTNAPIVILKDFEGEKALPIWIGMLEASAIAAELESLKFSRPMTHDLMREVLTRAEVSLDRIEINELKDNVFYAALHIVKSGVKHEIDARPSDAIALALRMNSQIFVDTKVLDQSKSVDLTDFNQGNKIMQDGTGAGRDISKGSDKWVEELKTLEDLSLDAFGKYKM